MCVKLLPRDLNPSSYPPHPTNTYTCGVTIASRVCGGSVILIYIYIYIQRERERERERESIKTMFRKCFCNFGTCHDRKCNSNEDILCDLQKIMVFPTSQIVKIIFLLICIIALLLCFTIKFCLSDPSQIIWSVPHFGLSQN